MAREVKTVRSVFAKEAWAFTLGDRVSKTKGSNWRGSVVGFYTSSLTPEGYCVESAYEPGSVQLYPRDALKKGWR